MPKIHISLYLLGKQALTTTNEFWAVILILFLWPAVTIMLFVSQPQPPDPGGEETIDNITTTRNQALELVAANASETRPPRKAA